jgi:hypothetical protein
MAHGNDLQPKADSGRSKTQHEFCEICVIMSEHSLLFLLDYATTDSMVEIIESLGEEVFKKQFGDSPQLLSFLEANFAGAEHAGARRQLLESTDESVFSLRQWVDSLRTVRAWLDVRGLEMSIEDELGYVCCAGDAAGAGANLTHLPALVAEMLDNYGCERALPRAKHAE